MLLQTKTELMKVGTGQMLLDEPDTSGASNHPLALRMAAIAFITNNLSIACVWGSFSVLLGAVETRLGIGRELSTMAAPAINLSTAIFAPVVGMLASKYSLRLIMVAGSIFSVAGFALLALTDSYHLYLVAFGLLLGPGMAAGVVLPSTLVTRWFNVKRGRALGIVCAPIVIALVPLATTWMLSAFGLPATYAALAALSAIALAANLFVVDWPAEISARLVNTRGGADKTAPVPVAGGFTMLQFIESPSYWVLILAFIASITGSIVLTAHEVPMARSWGFSAALGATLLTIQSLAGIGGTVFFGWIADRIGGALTLIILVFDYAVLWLLLLLHPPFAGVVLIFALIGVHGAGVVPVIGVALSQAFGRESFGRAYGLANLINLPFSVLCVPAASIVYARTGSYSGAILGVAVFLAITGVLAMSARRKAPEKLV